MDASPKSSVSFKQVNAFIVLRFWIKVNDESKKMSSLEQGIYWKLNAKNVRDKILLLERASHSIDTAEYPILGIHNNDAHF